MKQAAPDRSAPHWLGTRHKYHRRHFRPPPVNIDLNSSNDYSRDMVANQIPTFNHGGGPINVRLRGQNPITPSTFKNFQHQPRQPQERELLRPGALARSFSASPPNGPPSPGPLSERRPQTDRSLHRWGKSLTSRQQVKVPEKFVRSKRRVDKAAEELELNAEEKLLLQGKRV